MQPIDSRLSEEVWGRVLAGQNDAAQDAPAQSAAKAEDAAQQRISKTLELVQDEKNDAATYRYLSCRTSGAEARVLSAIAADETRHAKELGAMYFLLTGKCESAQAARPDCVSCMADALRARFAGELAGAEEYAAAAEACKPMAAEFRCLAADETRHSRMLLSLLEKRL